MELIGLALILGVLIYLIKESSDQKKLLNEILKRLSKKMTVTKDIFIFELDKGNVNPQIMKGTNMVEIQQDQGGRIIYNTKDDNGDLVNVADISVVSSNPEFLTAEAETQTEVGKYPFLLTWVSAGVGTLDMTATSIEGREPISDQEAFSTIPNIAESVTKDIEVFEL